MIESRPRRVVLTLVMMGILIPAFLYAEVSPTPTVPPSPTPKKTTQKDSWVHGYVTLDYDMRATSDGLFDNDLAQLFSLDLGDPYQNKVTANFLVGYLVDLDGNQGELGFYPLGSVYDGFQHRAVPLIYYAYVDAHKPVSGVIRNVRVGQQSYLDFESIYFIGAKVDTEKFNVFSMQVYGGIPVNTYEHLGGVDWGDWLTGAGLTALPMRELKMTLDYVHIHDDNFFRPGVPNLDDDLFVLQSWVRPDDHLSFHGKFSSFTDQVRDLTVDANWQNPKTDLAFQVLYFVLLDTSVVRPLAMDNFTIMGSQFPYHQVTLRGSKLFWQHLLAAAGAQFRLLTDKKDEGAYNHEFQRYFLTLSTLKWPTPGTTISVTGDYYSTFGGVPNDTFAVSGEIEQAILEKLKFMIGTSYSLYKFNIALLAETDDVRDYYGKLKWELTDHLDLQLRYAYEDSDISDIHSVHSGFMWRF